MDRRRGDYDSSSYRPSYAGNHYDRDSRPNVPSRSNSHVSRTFRAPDNRPSNSPSDSPQSPQTSYGENTRTTLTNKAAVSKDPRKTRGPESSTSDKPHSTPYESTVADYFRELAKQVSCEDKVQEAEKKLKATQQEERALKEKFSDNNPLADQYAKHRKRDEDALSECKNHLAESKNRAEKTLASLPPKTKDLFSGVIPTPKEASPRDELNDVKSAMKSLEEKIESLTKQNKQQEMELKQMRERNARPPSEPLETKLDSKITAFQRDVDSKFMVLDGKLQEYNESITLHEKTMKQQKEDLQKQSGEVRSLTSKQVGVTGSLSAFQSTLDKLVASSTRETPRSPPRDDLEDEITEIKAQQKEQKRQMANLSNMFVSRQEYSEGISQLEVSAGSMKKLLQDTDQAHQDLSSKIPTIVDRVSHLVDDLDKIKTSMKDTSATDSKILQERVDGLQKFAENLQKSIDTMSIVPAQTVTQASAHDAEVLLQLQKEVKKLSNFSGHYEDFYSKTEKQLKEMNQRLTDDDSRMTEMKNEYLLRFDVLSEICGKNKKDLDQSNNRQKSEAEEQRQHMNDVRKKINEYETSAMSGFAQNAATITDIKALKASVEQVSHSIQSLDTRYSAISTQKLYHSIVATIQPLIPRVLELTDQLVSVRNAVLVCEQRTTLINDKIKSMVVSKVEMESKIQALEAKARESSTFHAGQLITPQQDGETLQHAQSSSVQANSELQNEIVSLKAQHNNYLSQLQALQDKFATVNQALEVHQHTDLKVVDELNEIRGTLKETRSDVATLKTSLGEESKIVEKLRADVEIVDDLQSRIQSAQTDVTTHQERLAKIETDLSHLQDLEQRLNQIQAEFEEKRVENSPLDALHTEVEKTSEEINDSGMEDVELRLRVDKLEQMVVPDYFPATDRYVVCDNLASKINDEKVRLCFRDCAIRKIQFGGGKIPTTHKTTRYAIVWVALSTEDSVIDKAIEQQNGKPWDGRRPTIRRITRDQFRMIWMEEPDSVKNYIPDLPSLSNNRVSEAATTPGPIRGISVSHTEHLVPDNTIEVVRSSVLPKKSPTNPDITELPESDDEDLLEQFGATRDGRSSKPKIPTRAGSARPSTPSTRGAAKRGAPDSGSSRPSSKRGRRG